MLNRDIGYREPEQFRENQTYRLFWQRCQQDKLARMSLSLFFVLLILVLMGHWLAPYPHSQQFINAELQPPSWDEKGHIIHFLGTDDQGRDVFSRILAGFYYTVGSALLITFAVGFLGIAIGVMSALNSSKSGVFLSHLFDTFLFIPVLLMTIIIAALMEASLLNAMFAIFLVLLPHFIHRIYHITQQVLNREYALTLRLDGADKFTLIKMVVIPNVIPVVIQELATCFTFSLLDITALGFISLGAKSGTPEWGVMIRESVELIYIAPWTVILPGIAITMSILIVTLLSRRLSLLFYAR